MSDEHLNRAIDEVARRMTEGSPTGDAGFSRRLLARIESGGAPERVWRASWLLAPIAAAAVIAIAVVVTRGPQHSGGLETSAPRETVQRPPSLLGDGAIRTPDAAAAGPDRLLTEATPPRRADVRQARMPVETAPTLKQNDVASIAVAPLAVDTITPEPIQLERLDPIAPIIVAPLDIIDTSRRNQ
jgi:hypothetical protein